MKKKLKKISALTLTEILIVITILGVLASIALPNLQNVIEVNRTQEAHIILAALLRAQIIYKDFNPNSSGNYATALDSLDVTIPPPVYFDTLLVANNASALAQMTRNGASPYDYTLTLDVAGTISCSGGANNICERLGYPKSLGDG